MATISAALRAGLGAARRNWGLVALLLALNVACAALLAAPLAISLRSDLANREAAGRMLYGFDHGWWSQWHSEQHGFTREFGPEILGPGFAFRNLELLLRGELPGGLFARADTDDEDARRVDPTILGLGVLYMLLQTFLAGGVLGVLRAPQAGWSLRGLVHGSGFYFGRMFRVALLGLAGAWLVFGMNAPIARWVDRQAVEAVAESTALVWTFGRHLALLLALGVVFLVSSYAKVIVVLEERTSALLAVVSAVGFLLRNPLKALGHCAAIGLLLIALLASWSVVDGAWETTGFRSQLVTLALAQGLMFGRIFLRVGLLGGMLALYGASVRNGS